VTGVSMVNAAKSHDRPWPRSSTRRLRTRAAR
jgi:hypothetical protein